MTQSGTGPGAVTESSLGAWVFKVNIANWDIIDALAAGDTRLRSRCIAGNYRRTLMRRGQRALLWVSGPAAGRAPRGIWGSGVITGPSRPDPEAPGSWLADTDITLFVPDDAVHAVDLREMSGLASMEVFRSPQGSNPSWVTRDEFALIEPLLPRRPQGR